MNKKVKNKIKPLILALFTAFAITFAVLGMTAAIGADVRTVNAESAVHSHDGYTEWTSTNGLPTEAGNYYLSADVTIASGTWTVPSGTTNLCLNGHGIIGNNGNSVITVGSGATLYLEDCLDTVHKYTVDANHLATVDDSLEGAEGVGYFTFTGGYITGAKRTAVNSVGGGVNIEGGTLYINGGTIIGNSADRGGGVRCGGTLIMNGGAIRNNNANTANGGGQRNGGGLFINTTFTMNGGIITENWCANAGGAILLQSTATSFIMNGGAIVNNYNRGLSNNMAQKPVKIGSGAIIEGNVDKDGNPCDIWLLQSGNKIELLGELSNNKPIGVYMGTAAGTFTSGLSGKGTAVNFISTNDAYFVKLNGDGEAQLAEKVVSVTVGETVTYYDNVSDALSAWTDGSTLKLLKDVTAQITTSGGNKTLDLNDHSITYTGGTVIIVSGGTLRITDQSGIRTTHYYTPNLTGVATLSNTDTGYSFTGGYITGGVATEGRGGGLRVLGDGNVLFDSGTIFANSAGWGGGVWTSGSGSLTIEGTAAIIGNYSSGAYTSGGGIFMEGSSAVTMTGGSIRHNSAQWSGGGVRDCVDEKTGVRFTMTGGEITGNYAKNNQGNGFCFDLATTFNIGGTARIIDNQGTNDLFMYNGRYLTIVSPFEEGALIGVTLQSGTGTFTSGWATSMEDADPSDYFTSDAGYYVVSQNGEAVINDTLPHIHSWNYTAVGNVITATCVGEGDCNLSEQTLTITADGKTYDGTAVVATLSFSDGWTAANGLEIPSIYYSDGVNAATTTAPVSVGTYTAFVTIDEKTASVEFVIAQKTETIEPENSDFVVDGLAEVIQAISEENPTSNSVKVEMTVENKTEETAEKAEEIQSTAKSQTLEFFEIKVEKTIDDTKETLSETKNVLEISIPYAKTQKRGITVYSYHNSGVRTFVESNSKEDGTFRVDKENERIYVYTNKFSTFAIGYTAHYRVETTISLGSYTGEATYTVFDADGIAVDGLKEKTFTVGDKVVIDDIVKGKYNVTITWVDGVKNVLSMPLYVGVKHDEPVAEDETESDSTEEQGETAYSVALTGSEMPIESENNDAKGLPSKYEATAIGQVFTAKNTHFASCETVLIPRKREYDI